MTTIQVSSNITSQTITPTTQSTKHKSKHKINILSFEFTEKQLIIYSCIVILILFWIFAFIVYRCYFRKRKNIYYKQTEGNIQGNLIDTYIHNH